MSKSLNNIIGLTDEPNEMFGKTMSVPDSLINEFLDLATDFSIKEKHALQERLTNGENPMNIKKIIAKNIITQYHSANESQHAEDFFTNQFQNKNFEEKVFVPVSIQSLQSENGSTTLVDLCVQLKSEQTKSAIRRLIESGAVQINNEKMTEPYTNIELKATTKIKIGKRNFYELH